MISHVVCNLQICLFLTLSLRMELIGMERDVNYLYISILFGIKLSHPAIQAFTFVILHYGLLLNRTNNVVNRVPLPTTFPRRSEYSSCELILIKMLFMSIIRQLQAVQPGSFSYIALGCSVMTQRNEYYPKNRLLFLHRKQQ